MGDHFAIIVCLSQPGRVARLPVLSTSLWSRVAPIKTAPLIGVSSSFGEAAGRLFFLNYGPRQLQGIPRAQLTKNIIRAGRKAQRLGVRILGLGPCVMVALGGSAAAVARRLGLTLTGGHGYAAAAAIEGLQKAADLLGLSLDEAAVSVLGAAEPQGFVFTQMLAHDGVNHLTLVDNDHARLDLLSRRVLYECGVACKVSMHFGRAAAQADLVIVAGERAAAVLSPSDLKRGAIVCNLVETGDLTRDIISVRSDVIVFDGVVVHLPGEVNIGYDLGLPGGCVHAWMAEAVILALEGRFDRYFLGREMQFEKVSEMRRLAERHGVAISGFTAANKFVSFTDVQRNNYRQSTQSRRQIH